MKKRIVATLLCACMLVTALVGCNDEYTATRNSANAMTVVIAMVSDEIPTDKAVESVEKELTAITSQLYNIAIELEYYTPAQYRDVMDKKFENLQKAFNEGTIGNSIISGESYTVNEFGREEIKYLEPYEDQVDVLLVSDPLMLREYADKQWLYPINGSDCMTSVDGEGVLLTSYIPAQIRQLGDYKSATYAIPGNSLYSDYEYLLVNKALYNEYGTLPSDQITNIDSIKDFLLAVAENEDGVAPLYNVTNLGVTGFSGASSVVGQYILNIDQTIALTNRFDPLSIFDIAKVETQLSVICALDEAGAEMPLQTKDVDFTQEFGACYISGTPATAAKYSEDYYAIPVVPPIADTQSAYSAMYGVSAFSSAPARAFKILTLLSTNPGFINTLVYGVQDEHYTLDSTTGMVMRIADSGYNMSRYRVGNLFLTKQCTDMTERELELSADNWKIAKKMTGDMILSPYIGFELDYTVDPVNGISVSDIDEHLEMLYEELWIKVGQYAETIDPDTGEKISFSAFYLSLKNWLKNDPYVSAALSSDEESATSYVKQYIDWYNQMNGTATGTPGTDAGDEGATE